MFNSPLHFCTVCRAYVPLDESPRECAARHHCDVEHCPLAALFAQYQADASAGQPQPSRPDAATPSGIA